MQLRASGVRTCAVIVAAWRAAPWIGECLRSIDAQRRRPRWRYEVRVGVDGCEQTAQALDLLGRSYWWSPENVGAYVLRNSLIGLGRADAYAVFDADDVMRRDYLYELLRILGNAGGIAGSARQTVNLAGQITSRMAPYGHGVSVIGDRAWRRLGGYRSWRIAADSDLVARAKALGIRVRASRRPLYTRRKHPDSLTQAPETAMGSDARNAVKELSRELIDAGDLVVIPETVGLEPRGRPAPRRRVRA